MPPRALAGGWRPRWGSPNCKPCPIHALPPTTAAARPVTPARGALTATARRAAAPRVAEAKQVAVPERAPVRRRAEVVVPAGHPPAERVPDVVAGELRVPCDRAVLQPQGQERVG